MTRKLHDDMQLMEMASNSDPEDTLILIIAHVDRNTGERTIELGASSSGATRHDLLDVISEAYLRLAGVRAIDVNGDFRRS